MYPPQARPGTIVDRMHALPILALMKKLLPLASALILSLQAQAQLEHVMLVPNWKVGDARTLHIVRNINGTVNDTVRINTTDEMEAVVKVTKNTAIAYTIEMPYHAGRLMKALRTNVMGDHEEGGWDELGRLDLRYDVRKADGRSDLMNWEDVRRSIASAMDTLRTTAEDTAATGKAIRLFMPMLDTMEGVQWLVGDQIGWITTLYGKSMMPKDTLEVIEKVVDPLTLRHADSLTTTTKMVISSLDQAKQRLVVRSEVHYDTRALLARSKQDIMAGAGKHLKNEKDKAQARKDAAALVASFQASAKNLTITTVNTRTSWPSKVVSTTRTNSKQTGKRTALIETWTVDVKE